MNSPLPDTSWPIGREAVAGELTQWLRAHQAEGCALLLLGGEPGIGKTHLVEHLRASLGGELRFYQGRCWESTSTGAPYQPLLECLRQFSQGAETAAAWGDLIELQPLLAELLAGSTGQAPGMLAEERLHSALVEAFSALAAQGPAALVLEDLHWADDAALRFLPLLVERLRSAPLRILATFRGGELHRQHPLRACREAIRRGHRLREMELAPLDQAQSVSLLEEILGGPVAPDLRARLLRNSGGLPLWLAEMARTLQRNQLLRLSAEGEWALGEQADISLIPESFRDTVLMACRGLDVTAQSLLNMAAILGEQLSLPLLLETAGSLGAVPGETALAALLGTGLVREVGRGGKADFSHALTREVILENISWVERRELHSLAADLLAARGAPPSVLAGHFEQAGRLEEARRHYLLAAQASCALHAHREALAYGLHALANWPPGAAEPERLEIMELVANCGKLSGQLAEAVRILREIAADPQVASGRDPLREGRACSELATIYQLQGSDALCVETRLRAAQALERGGEPIAAAWEFLGVSSHFTDRIRLTLALEAVERAVELAARGEEHELHSRALSQLGLVLAMQGRVPEGRASAEEALSLATRHSLGLAAAEAYRRLALIHDYASDYHGETETFRKAISFCAINGVEGESVLCLSCMAFALMRTGDWKQALELCREVLGNAGLHELHHALARGLSSLIQVYRGEIKGVRATLEDCGRVIAVSGQVPVKFFTTMALGLLAELEGDDAGAAREYHRILEIWQDTEDTHDVLCALGAAARFFGDAGDSETLACLAETAGHVASKAANLEAVTALAAVLGELALVNREPAQAVTHLQQVASGYEQLKVPYELALSLHRLGLAQIAAGLRGEAVENLRKGYRLARNLGARPLAGKISAALAHIGESAEESRAAEAPERAVWAGLTQRQREVAAQIAQGLTNKEIAQNLFLSPRTIDMHVGHILGRLDCRTRSEAIRKLADLGVLPE